MHIKLTIEYEGTAYHGWQVQSNGVTVQEVLEKALERILAEPVRLYAAGRTDAGSHALGQVATFRANRDIHLADLQRGINAVTPSDVVVKKVEEVADGFDPRRHAKSRVYEYRIWNCPWPSPFWRRYSWHIPYPLNLSAMDEAASLLAGEHDFSSFQAAGDESDSAVRTVLSSSLTAKGPLIVYTIEATAFLMHMVRNVIGTLVEVGRGNLSVRDFYQIFQARDRRRAGPAAPPQGLFLVEVKYESRNPTVAVPTDFD